MSTRSTRNRIGVALLFAVAALGAASALAAPARAADRVTLSGVVVDAEGEPLEGIHVMVLEGGKRLPPFMIRPQAFGLPLPNVRVVKTDARGRFEVPRVKPGTKTVAVGEEGLLLFGRAALRRVEPGAAVRIQLSEDEMDAYLSLADRAERATEIIEEVLVEVDMALGWYVEARKHFDDKVVEARALLGLDDAERQGQGEETPEAKAARVPAAWERLRARVEELIGE